MYLKKMSASTLLAPGIESWWREPKTRQIHASSTLRHSNSSWPGCFQPRKSFFGKVSTCHNSWGNQLVGSPPLSQICQLLLWSYHNTHIPRIRSNQEHLFQCKYSLLIHALRHIQIGQFSPSFCISRGSVQELDQCSNGFCYLIQSLKQCNTTFWDRLCGLARSRKTISSYTHYIAWIFL